MFENTISFFYNLELACFNWLNHTIHNAVLDVIMPLLSYSGEAGLIWILLGLYLITFGKPETKKAGVLMLVALGASYLAGECLKHTIERPRPFLSLTEVELMVWPPGTYSFPSEHTANAFAVWFVLSRKQIRLSWLVALLALAMAVSRAYVGVHYPFDILAGSVLGTACAALVLKSENRLMRATNKITPPLNR
ncbi:MAG: phosphatase PAP2 family protein [Desulfotomaculaceae bacterium]|nr:phosphatase PAP2 family protein [Desulfotomaculaceae bacterium]